jgi:O-antigen/teichoic acid export membrane protein
MPLRNILRNVFSNYALLAVTALVTFILTPMLFHYLRPVNYGLLALALSLSLLLEAIDLGMSEALIRFVSEFSARGLEVELRKLVSTAFYLLAGLGTVMAALLAAVSPLLASFFEVPATTFSPGYLVLMAVGLSVAFELPSAALRSLLRGLLDFHRANTIDIAGHLLRGVLTVLFMRAGFGLLSIAAIFPAIGFLRLLGFVAIVRRPPILFRPRLRDVNSASLRRIREFATLSFLEDTVTQLFFQSDSFLAAKLLPLPQLAILVIARRFPWAVWRLASQATAVAYPMVSSAAARGNQDAVRKFVLVSTRGVLALALPLAAALYVWAGPILRLWVGPDVLSGIPVFRAFAVFAIFVSLQEIPLTVFYGLGKIRFSAALSVIMLAVAVGCGAWACTRGGLLGLVLAFTSVQAVGTSLLYWKSLELAGLDPRQWLKKAVVPTLGAALPTAGWLVLSYHLVPHSLLGLAFSIAAGLALFASLFVKLVPGAPAQSWQGRIRSLLAEID